LLCNFRVLLQLGASELSSISEFPPLQKALSLRPYHQSKTLNFPNAMTRKALSLLRDHCIDCIRQQFVKVIISVHNLTISHLETDYLSQQRYFVSLSFVHRLSTHSVFCCESTLDLHRRRPTEDKQVFSFSVMTILVRISAGF